MGVVYAGGALRGVFRIIFSEYPLLFGCDPELMSDALCLAVLFGSFVSRRIFVVGDVPVARSVVVGPTRPVAEGRMRRSNDRTQLLSQ